VGGGFLVDFSQVKQMVAEMLLMFDFRKTINAA